MQTTIQATALIVSSDAGFAETMQDLLQSWGMAVALSGGPTDSPLPWPVEIVLLDIRQSNIQGFTLVPAIREKMPAAEIILINQPDNIPLSIAGMQAGATDELIAPFDTGVLKNTISAALRRRKKRQEKIGALAAAPFALPGEFGPALALLDEPEEDPLPSGREPS